MSELIIKDREAFLRECRALAAHRKYEESVTLDGDHVSVPSGAIYDFLVAITGLIEDQETRLVMKQDVL